MKGLGVLGLTASPLYSGTENDPKVVTNNSTLLSKKRNLSSQLTKVKKIKTNA